MKLSRAKLNSKGFGHLEVVIGVAVIAVVVGVGVWIANKTSYQTAIQDFVTDMQSGDKAKVDSLESPAAKSYFQKNAGTASFYDACQKAGQFCTASFNASSLAKASKVYKDYTATDGTKGKELVYTIKEALSGTAAGGQDCSSDSSTSLTIAAVAKGSSWLIDSVNEDINANANLCPAPGGTSSVGN